MFLEFLVKITQKCRFCEKSVKNVFSTVKNYVIIYKAYIRVCAVALIGYQRITYAKLNKEIFALCLNL